jgi:hypothetical protein
MSTQGVLTSHPFAATDYDPFERVLTYDFVDFTEDGGHDRSYHPGFDFGPFDFFFNSAETIVVGDVTADPVAEVLTCPNHGLLTTDLVRFESDIRIPAQLSSTYYAVCNPITTNTFRIAYLSAPTVGIQLGDAGAGHIIVLKRAGAYDLTGWSLKASVKAAVGAPDPPLLALNVNLMTDTLGHVQILLLNHNQPSPQPALNPSAVWDMAGYNPGGPSYWATIVRGAFAINGTASSSTFP